MSREWRQTAALSGICLPTAALRTRTAPDPKYQVRGHLCWWWQVLGSNQRRLSRRFYRPLPLATRATCRVPPEQAAQRRIAQDATGCVRRPASSFDDKGCHSDHYRQTIMTEGREMAWRALQRIAPPALRRRTAPPPPHRASAAAPRLRRRTAPPPPRVAASPRRRLTAPTAPPRLAALPPRRAYGAASPHLAASPRRLTSPPRLAASA